MTARERLDRRGFRSPAYAPAEKRPGDRILVSNTKPIEQVPDGWITHTGDRCPVPGGTLIDVRYRCGGEQRVHALRLTRDWRNGEARFWVTSDGHANDIVAYRPVDEGEVQHG